MRFNLIRNLFPVKLDASKLDVVNMRYNTMNMGHANGC